MRRPHRLERPTSDPIAARCLASALDVQAELAAALEECAAKLCTSVDLVGLVLVASTGAILGMTRAELWQHAGRVGLDVPAPLPRFFPVVVVRRGAQPGIVEASVCWLGPLPDSNFARAS